MVDWNSVNFLAMEEDVEEEGNYYVHPHQSGTVAVMSSDDVVDVIPIEQGSNVVFRTLEGLSAGGAGVEVIGFLEEGQQTMHLVEGMNALPAGISEEEIIAQFQAQQQALLGGSQGVETAAVSEGQQMLGNVMEDDVVIVENVQQQGQIDSDMTVAAVSLPIPESVPATSTVIRDAKEHTEGIDEFETAVTVAELKQIEGETGGQTSKEPAIIDENVAVEVAENQMEANSESVVLMTSLSTESQQGDQSSNAPKGEVSVVVSNENNVSNKPSLEIISDIKKELDDNVDIVEVKPSAEAMDISSSELVIPDTTFKVPQSPSPVKTSSSQPAVVADTKPSTPPKPPVTVFKTVPESAKEEPIIIEITDDDDDDEGLLDDIPEPEDDIICISSDEEDEAYKTQMENARKLQKMKQSVDITAESYRPRYVSREKLGKRHPRCKDLTFKEIMGQAIIEDKILPDFNEQLIPRKVADKLRMMGHSMHKLADGSIMVSSKKRNIKCYHSSFCARFEPVLADPVLENYVQEYRKTLDIGMWKKRMFGRKEVDPSSVIPASIGSTGSSSIGSETDPECLATDEDESESELMQGSVAAWIIPDAIVSRTPSPEPDFDEPQFITTQVGSHAIVEGPPAKKRKQKHHEPKPHTDGKIYPKPAFSYSCLIAMALKNSKTGSLPVSEIYKFMCDHFPYFKSAPSGWKNSVRHNLSLNKCFEKIEKPGNNGARKGCLWALNPAKIHKMDEEVQKWSRKDPLAIRRAMSDPENLELIEKGELKRDYSGAGASDDDEDEDFSEPATPLTPAQVQARRSRTNSSDSTLEGTTAVVTPVVTTVSQVHAALQRSIETKSQIQVKREDTVELGTITNIQGNYVCHTPNGNGTYTLSFANIGSSSPLTPIIIRRTPTVK